MPVAMYSVREFPGPDEQPGKGSLVLPQGQVAGLEGDLWLKQTGKNWRKLEAGSTVTTTCVVENRGDRAASLDFQGTQVPIAEQAVETGWEFQDVLRNAERLRQLPPAAVKVSVDGTPETHNRLRGGKNFQACMEALEFFETQGVSTRVLCTTLNQRNFAELEAMFTYVRASAANFWEFHLAIREGRAAANQDWMVLERHQVAELFRFILENRKVFNIFLGEGCGYLGALTPALYGGRRFFCGSGWNTLTLMPNGDVAGCPAFDAPWTEGNVREQSVRSLWEHRFERFREELNLPKECRDCDYLPACGGGCWMMRRTGDHCFKDLWAPAAGEGTGAH